MTSAKRFREMLNTKQGDAMFQDIIVQNPTMDVVLCYKALSEQDKRLKKLGILRVL